MITRCLAGHGDKKCNIGHVWSHLLVSRSKTINDGEWRYRVLMIGGDDARVLWSLGFLWSWKMVN